MIVTEFVELLMHANGANPEEMLDWLSCVGLRQSFHTPFISCPHTNYKYSAVTRFFVTHILTLATALAIRITFGDGSASGERRPPRRPTSAAQAVIAVAKKLRWSRIYKTEQMRAQKRLTTITPAE